MTRPLSESAAPGAPPARPSFGLTAGLGAVGLAGLALLLLLGLVLSPPDVVQGEVVRLIYVHVPAAFAVMYLAVPTLALGSLLVLWRRSQFWDLVAASAAEIGLVLTAVTLLSGMVWGRATWGVYWVWDARLTTTALLLVLLLGYLAVRGLPAPPTVRARRAAVTGLVVAVDVPIIHYSVDWWRSLHQGPTISRLDVTMDGLMLFTLMLGLAVFAVLYVWLLIHRFRLEWLHEQLALETLERDLTERRAQAAAQEVLR
ncbi:MAG: cytochrome c biogenesis protein CcsA [Acidimicrobiales bacterium]